MPTRYQMNVPQHPDDNYSINKAFDRNYGNRLKSGDTTPLKYTIKDGDGEPLDKDRLMGMETTVKMKHEGVTAYEAEFEATLEEVSEGYEGDLVARYKITEALPPSDTPYIVEFHFEEADDRFIFPSGNNLELFITPSALNSDSEAIGRANDERLDNAVKRAIESDVVLLDIKDQEQQRIDNETARQSAENAREETFATNETDRQSTFETNEDGRQETFENNESERQTNYNELVDTGIMQENINQKLSESEQTYAPRLTNLEQNDADLTAQLAQTDEQMKSLEYANSLDELNLVNYLGNKQNIHPKVIAFENEWNGYKYWMAYTPYPNGATQHENPCLAVSNDKVNWTVPDGLVNPLDPKPEPGYNSDTHLVYRGDLDRLEIWWRQVSGRVTLYRRTSTDGVTWTDREAFFPDTGIGTNDMLSPAILFEDGKYKMWYIPNAPNSNKQVYYKESLDDVPENWTGGEPIDFEWGELTPWHLDVIKTDLGYEMITTAFPQGKDNNSADLYYHVQKTDGTLINPVLILKRSENPSAIDHGGIYRSSLLLENGVYYVFYSSIGRGTNRHMSLAFGGNIKALNGLYNHFRAKPGERYKIISPGSTLTEYNVSNIDTLLVLSGSEVTLNSLSNGYVGKEVNIVLRGGDAKVRFINNSRLVTPRGFNYLMTSSKELSLKMVCSEPNGNVWRVANKLEDSGYSHESIPSGTTLTDLDVNDLETLALQSRGEIFIESFLRGYHGKKVDIITIGSTTKVTFINSSALACPSGTNYTLDSTKIGVRVVNTGSTWRVLI